MRNISELVHRYFNASFPLTDLGEHANATFNSTTDTALIHVPVMDTIGNNDVQSVLGVLPDPHRIPSEFHRIPSASVRN